jgi:hypothetical protein
MRHLKVITEHEMVAHFLKTEIHSVRHGQAILELLPRQGQDRRIIDQPDLNNDDENASRARLLGEFRGYRRQEGIFRFVPENTAWHRYALCRDELARIRYINDDYWSELSGDTRRAIDAARNIRAGIEVFGQRTRWGLELAGEVERGVIFPELILVGTDEAADLTVLEGHVRLTAYCLTLQSVPEPLTAIVGFGPGMERV